MLREINGAELWVEEAGSGRPLVLIHAGITDCRMWDDQWISLTRDCRLIRYDLRGFGRSTMPAAPYSHPADLHGLLNLLRVESAVLVAASMGGEVAVEFALGHPGRVAGLVLVNTLAGMDTPSETLRAGWREMEAAFEAGNLDEAVEIELRMWVDGPRRTNDQVNPAARERVREMDLALLQRAGEQDAATELEPGAPLIDRLHEIACPVQIVTGALDMPDALASAMVLEARIPGAGTYVFPHAAHLPSMEAPQEFTRVVRDFLRSI